MENNKSCLLKKLNWIGYAIGAIGVGYFLWVHQAHVLQYIPYALLLLALSCICLVGMENIAIIRKMTQSILIKGLI